MLRPSSAFVISCSWLAIIGSGCGDPTIYPDYPTALATLDTDTADPLVDVPLACGRADEGTTAQLAIHNVGSEPLDLTTVDAACVETFQLQLAPGSTENRRVDNHLMWAVYDPSGRRVAVFGVPSGTQVSWVEYLP